MPDGEGVGLSYLLYLHRKHSHPPFIKVNPQAYLQGKRRGCVAVSGRGAFPACREREGVGPPYLGGEPFPPVKSQASSLR